MQSINIRVEHGKINVTVDGVMFKDVHSFSLDYVKGMPLLFSCVSEINRDEHKGKQNFVS